MGQTQYTNRFAIDPKTAATFGTEELRENFLLPPLFVNDTVQLHYTNYDRMVVDGAVPVPEQRIIPSSGRWRATMSTTPMSIS